jgi:hypothetical protein
MGPGAGGPHKVEARDRGGRGWSETKGKGVRRGVYVVGEVKEALFGSVDMITSVENNYHCSCLGQLEATRSDRARYGLSPRFSHAFYFFRTHRNPGALGEGF